MCGYEDTKVNHRLLRIIHGISRGLYIGIELGVIVAVLGMLLKFMFIENIGVGISGLCLSGFIVNTGIDYLIPHYEDSEL